MPAILAPLSDDGRRAKAVCESMANMIAAAPNEPLKNQSRWREELRIARYEDWKERQKQSA